jgi:hypothetical protein
MRGRIAHFLAISLLGTGSLCLTPASLAHAETFSSSAKAGPVSGGELTSGKPVHGVVSTPDGTEYTFTAVAGKHVTMAITNAHVTPSDDGLLIQAFDSSGNPDTSQAYFGDGSTEIDFTPTAAEAGTTTVIIQPDQFGTTGSYTITYAKDVTGKLASGISRNGTLKYEGQHADYTFTAIKGKHVTVDITGSNVTPSDDGLLIQAFDSSGNPDTSQAYFGDGSTEIDFTPTAAEAGTTTVIIQPDQFGTTGSYTITYTSG